MLVHGASTVIFSIDCSNVCYINTWLTFAVKTALRIAFSDGLRQLVADGRTRRAGGLEIGTAVRLAVLFVLRSAIPTAEQR